MSQPGCIRQWRQTLVEGQLDIAPEVVDGDNCQPHRGVHLEVAGAPCWGGFPPKLAGNRRRDVGSRCGATLRRECNSFICSDFKKVFNLGLKGSPQKVWYQIRDRKTTPLSGRTPRGFKIRTPCPQIQTLFNRYRDSDVNFPLKKTSCVNGRGMNTMKYVFWTFSAKPGQKDNAQFSDSHQPMSKKTWHFASVNFKQTPLVRMPKVVQQQTLPQDNKKK